MSSITEGQRIAAEDQKSIAEVEQALHWFYHTSDHYLQGLRSHNTESHFREYLRIIRKHVPAGARLLDLGCGTGYSCRLLAETYTVVGVDLSLKFLADAQKKTGIIGYTAADGLKLPFRDGAFDAVASFDMLEHVLDASAALLEMRRVVRPEGRIVVLCPNYFSPVIPIKALLNLLRGGAGYLSFYERKAAALRGIMQTSLGTVHKMIMPGVRFVYRVPRLQGALDSDCDCVYLPSPIDLKRFLKQYSCRIVQCSREGSTPLRKVLSMLFPAFAPTIYLVAEKELRMKNEKRKKSW